MRKFLIMILLIVAGLCLFSKPLLAQTKKQTRVVVLSEKSFVVVQGRGADNSSIQLYRVHGEKLQLLDALVVDGEFADVSRPTIRVLRATQYTPRK